MPARDMYADLEKIEARGKRKKEKRKGFFSFSKKEEPQELEPAPETAPVVETPPEPSNEESVSQPETAPMLEPEFETEMEDMSLAESGPVMEQASEPPESPEVFEAGKEPEPPDAQIIQTEPVSPRAPDEPDRRDNPMDMLEFSESPVEEDESPEAQSPGTDPYGAQQDPAGFSSMPVTPEPEEISQPKEPARVISLEESASDARVEPVPEVIPGPVPEPFVEPPAASGPIPEPAPQPVEEPVPESVSTPQPFSRPPEPAKPQWQPLTGQALAHAEAHIHEYKLWLNKKYKAGKFSREECSHKLWQKEVEIGLRPPQ